MLSNLLINLKFDKSKRLVNAAEFQAVFQKNTLKVSNKHLLLLAKPSAGDNARIGLVIAKKNVRLAVERNRLKRVIRESFRSQQDMAPIDVVVLTRKGIHKRQNQELFKDLEQLWRQLNDKFLKSNRRD